MGLDIFFSLFIFYMHPSPIMPKSFRSNTSPFIEKVRFHSIEIFISRRRFPKNSHVQTYSCVCTRGISRTWRSLAIVECFCVSSLLSSFKWRLILSSEVYTLWFCDFVLFIYLWALDSIITLILAYVGLTCITFCVVFNWFFVYASLFLLNWYCYCFFLGCFLISLRIISGVHF